MSDGMKAIRIHLGGVIEPFGEMAADLPILGEPLLEVQNTVLGDLGFELVVGSNTPCLIFADHVWFTPALIRAFLEKCPETGGRLCMSGPFVEYTRPLQELGDEESARFPIFWSPTGSIKELDLLPSVTIEGEVRLHRGVASHSVFEGIVDQPVPVTVRMAHTIEHWVHLHRVNLLALMEIGERERLAFKRMIWFKKVWRVLKLLLRSRSLSQHRLAAALTEKGRGCKVHPTAIVEASLLGDGVEIGPYAVVRGSFLAANSIVQEHAQVHVSILGEGAIVGRTAMVRMCVLMKKAMVSKSQGVQSSLFGRDTFVAVGATLYDLSFGGNISVWHKNERVSTGQKFLGSCLGHRVKIGPHVRIGYGECIPNDAFIVADPKSLVRNVGDLLPGEPYALVDGELSPIKR